MRARALGLLLRALPRDFRAAHGRALFDAARDELRNARRVHGPAMAVVRVAPRMAIDLAVTALRLRRDRLFGARRDPDRLHSPPHDEKNRMDSLFQDIRYGVRHLLRTPWTTAVAVVALALGIGANTLIFSLLNGIVLQPLPFQEPDRLVHVWESNPGRGWPRFTIAPLNYRDWKEQATGAFASMTGMYGQSATLTGFDDPVRIQGAAVADDFFQTLGTEMALGRPFGREEHVAGANAVVVIAPSLWGRLFGFDPDVIGRTLTLDDVPRQVVGVLADAAAAVPSSAEIWTPMDLDDEFTASRGAHYWRVIARMRDGISVEQATEEIERVAERLPLASDGWTALAASMHADLTTRAGRSLRMLFAAVGLVLLIACANVANLLLARSAARARELSLRQSVGASAGRLFRQLITESVVLATLGALAGVGVATVGLIAVRGWAGDALPRMQEVSLDPAVLLFTLGVGIATGLVFGVAPAIQGGRVNPAENLKEGAGVGAGRRRARVRRTLVVVEVALAVSVVGVAGLLTRSLVRIQSVDPGFAIEQRLTARISLPRNTYAELPGSAAFYDEVLEKLRASPGVVHASATGGLPLVSDFSISFSIVGREADPEVHTSAEFRTVDAAYFDTMQIPLLQGRGFAPTDNLDSERVIIVNRKFVDTFLPGEGPLDVVLDVGYGDEGDPTERRIIGVVGDVKSHGLENEILPIYYVTRQQDIFRNMSVVMHTAVPPEQALGLLRAAVSEADPNLPVYQVRTLEGLVGEATGDYRFRLGLIASFALLALLLASIGIYGMMSVAVTQRQSEIGLRLAVGASPKDVLRLVLSGGLGLAVIGVLLGTLAAVVLGRVALSSSFLYGVPPHDPVTLAAVGAILLAVAALACWLPARRATRVDPVSSLRAS